VIHNSIWGTRPQKSHPPWRRDCTRPLYPLSAINKHHINRYADSGEVQNKLPLQKLYICITASINEIHSPYLSGVNLFRIGLLGGKRLSPTDSCSTPDNPSSGSFSTGIVVTSFCQPRSATVRSGTLSAGEGVCKGG